MQEQFVTEARELVRQATDDLIALERDGASPERIDRVFRAFHTLKGSAGVVELPAMSIMLHAAEDLLASVKQGTVGARADIIDSALACLDQVSRWIDDFETSGALPAQAGEECRAMADRLRSFLPSIDDQDAKLPARKPTPGDSEAALPEWASRLIAADRDAMASRMPKRPFAASAISYEPIAGCFYTGDDPLQYMRQFHICWRFTSKLASPFRHCWISIPMPVICAFRPFRPETETKSPRFFGWCRIRCASSAFRSTRFLRRRLVPATTTIR